MITAAEALRNVIWRRRTAALNRLAELSYAATDAVITTLERLPPDAQVNLARLIDEARKAAAERAASRNQPSALGIFQYGLQFMSTAELERLRDDLRARVEAGEGNQPYYVPNARSLPPFPTPAETADDADPDDELDEADDLPDEQPEQPRAGARSAVRSGAHRPTVGLSGQHSTRCAEARSLRCCNMKRAIRLL